MRKINGLNLSAENFSLMRLSFYYYFVIILIFQLFNLEHLKFENREFQTPQFRCKIIEKPNHHEREIMPVLSLGYFTDTFLFYLEQ